MTNGRLTAHFRRKSASDSHFRPNRKWKCVGNRTHELAAIDFLFDRNTNYGSIRNRFYAVNYFRFLWNRSTDIGRFRTSKTVLEPPTSDYRTITASTEVQKYDNG